MIEPSVIESSEEGSSQAQAQCITSQSEQSGDITQPQTQFNNVLMNLSLKKMSSTAQSWQKSKQSLEKVLTIILPYTDNFVSSQFKNITVLPRHKFLQEKLSLCQIALIQSILSIQQIEEDQEYDTKQFNSLYFFLSSTAIFLDNEGAILFSLNLLTESLIQNFFLNQIIHSTKPLLICFGMQILQSIDIKEQTFSQGMQTYIKCKEEQIESLKYQICRICEQYILLNNMNQHLKQCQFKYQKLYFEQTIVQKGSKIYELTQTQHQNGVLCCFFEHLYCLMGHTRVQFLFENDLQGVKQAIQMYGKEQNEVIEQTIAMLKDYQKILTRQEAKGYESEDGISILSKRSIKCKTSVNKKGRKSKKITFLPSSHSINYPQSSHYFRSHEIESEKTIQSESSHLTIHFHSLIDFQILKFLGQGSFSEVYLVRSKATKDVFAMKVIQFNGAASDKLNTFKQQLRVYKSLCEGYTVKLSYSFNEDNLYCLLLDYAPGGSLAQLLEREVYLQEEDARLYIANLILAADSLHGAGIVHQDLKPANVVINEQGYLQLTDFNLSKIIEDPQMDKSEGFFGSPDYIAPQVLQDNISTKMRDYFSIGVIAYELLVGARPFGADTVQEVFQNIIKGQIEWPEIGYEQGMISPEAKSFIEDILASDPQNRLGFNGREEIKNHVFFKDFQWEQFQSNKPMYVPRKETEQFQEDNILTERIHSKRKKLQSVPQYETVIRYDILKQKTNKYARSQRHSIIRLQKQLNDLKQLNNDILFEGSRTVVSHLSKDEEKEQIYSQKHIAVKFNIE